MTHTYDELHKMTVAQLRGIAEELGDHAELHGYTTMHKEQLLPVLCGVLGIEAHVHHEIVGVDKARIKAEIRELKAQRNAALEAKDRAQLKAVRRKIHHLKRKLRRAMV